MLCHIRRMRRSDICLYLGPADRAELHALITNPNTSRKLVWRAEIILATADGHGTFEIMRRARTSKPTVWRWQQRYLDEGVAGLKRDKTRPSRVPPLPQEVRLKVIAKTVQETPANATHWSRALMAEANGSGLDAVVINTSGCGNTVKDYGHMFADDPMAADAASAARRSTPLRSNSCFMVSSQWAGSGAGGLRPFVSGHAFGRWIEPMKSRITHE